MITLRTDPKVRELRALDLFGHLTRRQLRRLARTFDVVDVEAGLHLTDQGHLGREFFVVAGGTADVILDGKVINTVGRGELLGELAVLDNIPRTATIVARTPMRLFVAESRTLQALLTDVPVLHARVAAIHDAHRAGLAH